MKILNYNREDAVLYAKKWALSRNPLYYNFDSLGGDCTNFVSQCIYAGAKVMNYTPVFGWFYRNVSDRTASWTGVEYLYNFLVNNDSVGPFGRLVERSEVKPGDVVQLGDGQGNFYHTPFITKTFPEILVAAHTFDALDRPLDSYNYEKVRFIHIEGVKL